jgi:hypothetical protein
VLVEEGGVLVAGSGNGVGDVAAGAASDVVVGTVTVVGVEPVIGGEVVVELAAVVPGRFVAGTVSAGVGGWIEIGFAGGAADPFVAGAS